MVEERDGIKKWGGVTLIFFSSSLLCSEYWFLMLFKSVSCSILCSGLVVIGIYRISSCD